MKRIVNGSISVLVACLLVICVGTTPQQVNAAQVTWYVSVGGDNANAGTEHAPFRTIEYALTQASAGDTVLVEPGTYSFDSEQSFPILLTPGVTLASTGGAEFTTIQGDGVNGVVRIVDPVEDTEISGFTITGGAGSGAGIAIERTSGGELVGWPRVTESVIESNSATPPDGIGGGIYVQGAADAVARPYIGDCVIRDNTAQSGAGMFCNNHTHVEIEGCTVEGNTAVSNGGGIVSLSTHGITVTGCTVRDNESTSGNTGGGGLYFAMSMAPAVSIAETTIEGNRALYGGGALIWVQNPTITRTAFVDNVATVGGGGGVLFVQSEATLEDCLIAGNEAATRGGALHGSNMIVHLRNSTVVDNAAPDWNGIDADGTNREVTLHNSVVWGHEDEDVRGASAIEYSCTQDSDLAGSGNAVGDGVIHAYPLFLAPLDRDYRLTGGSPCIDTADPADYTAQDFFGTARPVDGNEDGTAAPDMGYHEYTDAIVTPPMVRRIAGNNRYETAVEIAKEYYAAGATRALVASGENFPDALSAAGLAGALDAPLLLVRRGWVPAVVLEALATLGVEEVTIVGGTAAVFNAVEDTLVTEGYAVDRIAGNDRYATAAKVAEEIVAIEGAGFSHTAFIARGDDFPDALAVSPLAYTASRFGGGAPILLTRPESLPGVTASVLTSLGIQTGLVIGGSGAVSADVKTAVDDRLIANGGTASTRWAGSDRYFTARAVADGGVTRGWAVWDHVGIATGANYPDALAGGVATGSVRGVVLLTRTNTLSAPTAEALGAHSSDIEVVTIFGGTEAISAAVREAIEAALGL